MITCTLGDKKYTVDYVNGRAMRNIGKALDAWEKMADMNEQHATNKAVKLTGEYEKPLDVMVSWFCDFLFKGQFNTEEFYDTYPADRMLPDLYLAIQTTYTGATRVLNEFPTNPAAEMEIAE